jgi:hypothetical protein
VKKMEVGLDLLVKKFAEAVMHQKDAIKRADPKAANEHAKDQLAAFDELRAHGNAGREALTVLFDHESADVRVSAAAFLLRYCESRARAVLETEARRKGLPAFAASQALTRWEDGEWELDPD